MEIGGRIAAPAWPVAATLIAAASALTCTVLGSGFINSSSVPLLACGYFLGAVVCVIFLSVYRAFRNGLRAHPRFRPQPWIDRLVVTGVAVGLVSGLASAFFLATELAK